jgi:cyclic pyranopterin phosphate synthase
MVDVGGKPDTQRAAAARGRVVMKPETLALIQERGLPKGDVLAVAQVAGVMAAKRAHDLIPMCHPLLLTSINVVFEPQPPVKDDVLASVEITATVRCAGKTGVEMEALTAVSIAALTVYDMIKAVQRDARIMHIRLLEKHGGKSGDIVLEDRS